MKNGFGDFLSNPFGKLSLLLFAASLLTIVFLLGRMTATVAPPVPGPAALETAPEEDAGPPYALETDSDPDGLQARIKKKPRKSTTAAETLLGIVAPIAKRQDADKMIDDRADLVIMTVQGSFEKREKLRADIAPLFAGLSKSLEKEMARPRKRWAAMEDAINTYFDKERNAVTRHLDKKQMKEVLPLLKVQQEQYQMLFDRVLGRAKRRPIDRNSPAYLGEQKKKRR